MLPEWLPVVAKPQALYIGGPLNQQSVVGLAQTKQGVDVDKQDRLTRLAPRLAHVDLRADPEEIEPLVSGPGQLEEEIEAGEWFVSPALAQDVITPGPADLWADVMKRQPMPLPLYSTYPVNVEDN